MGGLVCPTLWILELQVHCVTVHEWMEEQLSKGHSAFDIPKDVQMGIVLKFSKDAPVVGAGASGEFWNTMCPLAEPLSEGMSANTFDLRTPRLADCTGDDLTKVRLCEKAILDRLVRLVKEGEAQQQDLAEVCQAGRFQWFISLHNFSSCGF